VNGGSGTAVMLTGAGGGTFVADSADNTTVFGGSGQAAMYGTADGDQLTAMGNLGDYLQAGAGNETLCGANSAGNDTLVGGTGNAFMSAGSGSDTFRFVSGQAGGNYFVENFDPAKDKIQLVGYGASANDNARASQQPDGANGSIFTLPDGSRVDLSWVGSLNQRIFA